MLVALRSQRVNFFLSGSWGGFNWVSFGDSSISLVLLYFVDCDWSVKLLQSSPPVWFCIFCFFVAFFKDVKDKTFLEVINRYVEVHGTVGGGVSIVATSNGRFPITTVDKKASSDTPLFVEYDFAQVHWVHFHPEQPWKSIFMDGSVFSALYSDHVSGNSESEILWRFLFHC